MDNKEAKEILTRYRLGRCTDAERAWVEDWYLKLGQTDEPLSGDRLIAATDRVWQRLEKLGRPEGAAQPLPEFPHTTTPDRQRKTTRFWPAAAAAVLLLGMIGGWYFFGKDRVAGTDPADLSADTEQLLPGGNRATLTLADGRTVELSGAQPGIVIGEELTYMDGSDILSKDERMKEQGLIGRPESSQYQLSTPKGGTYQVTLPDGSRVWLNAGSTLKYPSRFDGDERIVELAGEAYFEIQSTASTTRLPFKVITGGQIVEVLGTRFNVSAYADDEASRTTLVEGRVRIQASGGSENASFLTLVPGDQAITQGAKTSVHRVETDLYTAWKEGYFAFDNTPIDVVMKQLGRWYDIDVRYEGRAPTDRFDGEISRDLTLQQVLNGLAATRINYRIEGRTLTITGQQ